MHWIWVTEMSENMEMAFYKLWIWGYSSLILDWKIFYEELVSLEPLEEGWSNNIRYMLPQGNIIGWVDAHNEVLDKYLH